MRLRGATAAHPSCTDDEAQARTYGDGSVSSERLDGGGDSRGGAPINESLAPLSCTMEGLRSDMGGMAAARAGGSGRSGGELGVGCELGGYGGVGTVEGFELRACSQCTGATQFVESFPIGVLCDGKQHVGPAEIVRDAGYSCYSCRLDWCRACASKLNTTMGAQVVRIRLKLDPDAHFLQEPTLGLGWAHAVSSHCAAASGPVQLRDHGHFVSKFKYDRLLALVQSRPMKLESEHVVRAQSFPETKLCTPMMRKSVRNSRCEQTPPVMMQLRDDTVRGQHELRNQGHQKYCTTKVTELQRVIESQQTKVAAAEKNAQLAHQKEMNARKLLLERKRRNEDELLDVSCHKDELHRRQMDKLREQLTTQFSKELQQARSELVHAHAQHERAANQLLLDIQQTHRAHEVALSEERTRWERLLREKEHDGQMKLATAQRAHDDALRQMQEQCERALEVERANAASQAKMMQKRVTTLQHDLACAKGKYKAKAERMQRNMDKLTSELDGQAVESVGRPRLGLRQKYNSLLRSMESLRRRLNLRGNALPAAEIPEECTRHNNLPFYYNVQFLIGALEHRAPSVIAAALARLGLIRALFKTKEFQPVIQQTIKDVLQVIQHHWSARMAVILMQEVHTSRSEFDALRHLLSFVYDRTEDVYKRIKVWVDPYDCNKVEYVPTLTARGPRERERAVVYQACGAAASEDGLFVGIDNLEEQAARYVAHYWDGIDAEVRCGNKPLVLVLTGDATGGWRGDAVTHGELGIASWSAGKAQSRLTLLPLFLMEGDDSAENLRNRAMSTATSYNKLKLKGVLTVDIQGRSLEMSVKLLVAADFQFFKATMNMSKYTSAVWCTCQLDNLFKRPSQAVQTWEQVWQH